MPTASLTYSATPSVPSQSVFRVDWAIGAFSEFPDDKVFLLRSVDDSFARIAQVDDLSVWPATKDPQVEFYRSSTARKNYADPDTAGRGMDEVELALDSLVQAYARFREAFATPRSETFSETFT